MTRTRSSMSAVCIATMSVTLALTAVPRVRAQNAELQQRVAEIKQAIAANKQMLAQYTWHEQQTVSVKGQVRKYEQYAVRIGPDGKPQKTPLDTAANAAGKPGGVKGDIAEKKVKEYEDYAKQMAALAQSYAQPNPAKLQQLAQQGQVTLGSSGGPSTTELVIHNYVKQGDSVTVAFDRTAKALTSLHVGSYLSKPSDAVTISAQYVREPDGPNHVQDLLVDGVSKQLTLKIENSLYQKL